MKLLYQFLYLVVFTYIVISQADDMDGENVLHPQSKKVKKGRKYKHRKMKQLITRQEDEQFYTTMPPLKYDQLNVSRIYVDANILKRRKDYDPEFLEYVDGNDTEYEQYEKLGEGAFSNVYRGKRKDDESQVVLKVLKQLKRRAINREIQVLTTLRGQSDNIVEMVDAIRNSEDQKATLVYTYINSTSFSKVIQRINLDDLKHYMYQLLMAMDKSHSLGIMHRDIKAGNIIVDENTKLLKLIDWGLGEFYLPEKNYSVKAGTRYYKAPELFLGYHFYDYSVDMWSFGCVLGAIVDKICFYLLKIFQKHPFFKGIDNDEQLLKIVKVLGTNDLLEYVNKYSIDLPEERKKNIGNHTKKDWGRFVTKKNYVLATKEAVDLVSKILIYDHRDRLTAKESMKHSFFDGIREKFQD